MNSTDRARQAQGIVALPDWGLIRAEGADAASFLQGQLTQDVAAIPQDGARLAGYCSPKGRLLASFVVWRPADDVLLLACSADLLAPTLKRLAMYVLRARCKLTDASASTTLWGLAGTSAQQALGAAAPAAAWGRAMLCDGDLIRLPDATADASAGAADGAAVPRYLLAAAAGTRPALTDALPALPLQSWQQYEVQAGVVRIAQSTVERYVPQMVNYELVGGVDFKKGCYPGQEIVARSQYRGTIKRRTLAFRAGVPLQAGDEVYGADDAAQPAGSIAMAAPAGHGSDAHVALVELKLSAAHAGPVTLGGPFGAVLEPLPLPYALPADAD